MAKKRKVRTAGSAEESVVPPATLRRSRRISQAQTKEAEQEQLDLAEVGQVGQLEGPDEDHDEDEGGAQGRRRKVHEKSVKAEATPAPLPSPGEVEVPEASAFPTLALKLHGLPSDRISFYGLVQEIITPDVFGMLIVTILLNQTTGRAAIPVFYDLLERWPTPSSLRDADLGMLTDMLQPIGLHNIRAKRLKDLGTMWCEQPPQLGVLHKSRVVLPSTGRKRRKKKLDDDEEEPQKPTYPPTEISHLPGAGRYALDSYRLFRPSLVDTTRATVQIGLGPKPESDRWQLILAKREAAGESRSVGSLLPASDDDGSKLVGHDLEEDWKTVDALDKELKAYRLWRAHRQAQIDRTTLQS
ncbi:DNA glycosylase [Jaminaea rosea]|uniref:DNA glycosylase n=1 Tax=Jaminaea rosea TaxID=1569628 RepID=A0A316UW25_9BASI|nr:DNA glycosylase [Jaminaea rosea]PWN29204.1 DNA glycosylase [Jaminaea rosea]